jgi:hypothetical protein
MKKAICGHIGLFLAMDFTPVDEILKPLNYHNQFESGLYSLLSIKYNLLFKTMFSQPIKKIGNNFEKYSISSS